MLCKECEASTTENIKHILEKSTANVINVRTIGLMMFACECMLERKDGEVYVYPCTVSKVSFLLMRASSSS